MKPKLVQMLGILIVGTFAGCSWEPPRDNPHDGPIPVDAFHIGVSSQHFPAQTANDDSFFVRVILDLENARIESASLIGPNETTFLLVWDGSTWSGRFPGSVLHDPFLLHAEDYGFNLTAMDWRGIEYKLGPVFLYHVFRTIPIVNAPVNQACTPLRVTFSWVPLPEDLSVEFQYVIVYNRMTYSDDHLDDGIEDVFTAYVPRDSSTYTPTQSQTAGFYSWTLYAIDAFGDSVRSKTNMFEVVSQTE
ncbi:hypothetical protein EHM69_05835 [candidate division KSB1 bacterium]|nr:MAG: hypothetical protein EHM69_05835 [candidate division KSB1 bacterium]